RAPVPGPAPGAWRRVIRTPTRLALTHAAGTWVPPPRRRGRRHRRREVESSVSNARPGVLASRDQRTRTRTGPPLREPAHLARREAGAVAAPTSPFPYLLL